MHRMHATKMDEDKTGWRQKDDNTSTNNDDTNKIKCTHRNRNRNRKTDEWIETNTARTRKETKREWFDTCSRTASSMYINALCVLAMHPPIGITISLTKNIHTSPCKKNNQSSGDMKWEKRRCFFVFFINSISTSFNLLWRLFREQQQGDEYGCIDLRQKQSQGRERELYHHHWDKVHRRHHGKTAIFFRVDVI